MIEVDRVIRKSGARPGDKLVLSKPLGTGVITTALKRGMVEANHIESAIEAMSRLNDRAANIAQKHGVRAMTDITGFGLVGHAQEIARLSQVDLSVDFERLCWLPVRLHMRSRVCSQVGWTGTGSASRAGSASRGRLARITNRCCMTRRLRAGS